MGTYRLLEFQKMWSEIPIPDETDLPKKLESGGFLYISLVYFGSWALIITVFENSRSKDNGSI